MGGLWHCYTQVLPMNHSYNHYLSIYIYIYISSINHGEIGVYHSFPMVFPWFSHGLPRTNPSWWLTHCWVSWRRPVVFFGVSWWRTACSEMKAVTTYNTFILYIYIYISYVYIYILYIYIYIYILYIYIYIWLVAVGVDWNMFLCSHSVGNVVIPID